MPSAEHAGITPEIWDTSGDITIISPSGFHARPAALFVKVSKKFTSNINIIKGDFICNAKSPVSIMGLALQQGDVISLAASGVDAKEAIEALVPILSGNHETLESASVGGEAQLS
jgi:phosphotransferase system HPr (HPr) family protein